MARNKKSDQEEVKKPVDEAESAGEKKPKKKKTEYTGSRWAAAILLILTVLVGLWFYIDGLGGWSGLAKNTRSVFEGIGWEKRYTLD